MTKKTKPAKSMSKTVSLKAPEVETESAPETTTEPQAPTRPKLSDSRRKELGEEVKKWNDDIMVNALKAKNEGDPDGALKYERNKMYEYRDVATTKLRIDAE